MKFSHVDPAAAAEFIVRRLYKPLDFGEISCRAVAETETAVGGDTWFWTDDNAKVIEFLARPELGDRYRQPAEEVLRFVRLMCRGPLIFRRVATPRLQAAQAEGSQARFEHSLMQIRCDLPLGAVAAGIRFHDGRTTDNLLLWTNFVEFVYRRRKYRLPVERCIDRHDAILKDHRLELRFSGELSFTPRRSSVRVGRFSYAYSIDARSMLIRVEAALDVDSMADISDVILTIGHDHLSHDRNHVNYSSLCAAGSARAPLRFTAGDAARQVFEVAGADYYAFLQSPVTRIAGFSLGAHSAPREPGRLAEIEVEVREPGRLHLVRARYRFGGACRGSRLVAAEHKLLTAGGVYNRLEEYRRLLHHAIATQARHAAAIDYSVSYDYGAELNAFAQYFHVLAADGSDCDRDEIKTLYDFYLETYFELFVAEHLRGENAIYVRQLAFVVLSVVTMYRATGAAEYRQRLAQLGAILLEFESRFADVAGEPASGFVLGVHRGTRIVYADCHSAALLALAEAAGVLDDPRWAAAIDRGLASYGMTTSGVEVGDRRIKADLVSTHWIDDNGARQTSDAFWNFHAGLTLRLFGALRKSANPVVRAVAARHRDRIELFEMVLRRQIDRSLTWHDGAVEIRTSTLSSETNSETQPWVALGLLELASG